MSTDMNDDRPLDDITKEDLMANFTHEEVVNLFLSMREGYYELCTHFEKAFSHAKSLEIENNTIKKRLSQMLKK